MLDDTQPNHPITRYKGKTETTLLTDLFNTVAKSDFITRRCGFLVGGGDTVLKFKSRLQDGLIPAASPPDVRYRLENQAPIMNLTHSLRLRRPM